MQLSRLQAGMMPLLAVTMEIAMASTQTPFAWIVWKR